jgi:hypothetical protein
MDVCTSGTCIGRIQRGVVPERTEKVGEEGIARVARTSQVVVLYPIQELRHRRRPATSFERKQQQLGDVLERHAAEMPLDEVVEPGAPNRRLGESQQLQVPLVNWSKAEPGRRHARIVAEAVALQTACDPRRFGVRARPRAIESG